MEAPLASAGAALAQPVLAKRGDLERELDPSSSGVRAALHPHEAAPVGEPATPAVERLGAGRGVAAEPGRLMLAPRSSGRPGPEIWPTTSG